jgi:hypothetical protein
MKRIWIILLAVAVALVIALPAAAFRPDKPGRASPKLFDVTMSFRGTNNGFATTCPEAESITMELSQGRLMAVDVPILKVNFPEIGTEDNPWYRYYPYYVDEDAATEADFDPNDYPLSEPERLEGTGLTGCHGAGIDVFVTEDAEGNKEWTIEQYPGLLMLTVRDGTVDLIWHTDYYREWMPRKNGRWGISDIEDFTYGAIDTLTWTDGADSVDWDSKTGGSGVVTGDVGVVHFSPGSYVPFEGSPVSVDFTLTIEPISP